MFPQAKQNNFNGWGKDFAIINLALIYGINLAIFVNCSFALVFLNDQFYQICSNTSYPISHTISMFKTNWKVNIVL